MEQQQLYEQFHLDEPWDSPHNIQLLEQIPPVYVDPSVPAPPGNTVFQLPVGQDLMFQETGERRFRDVIDGLSNTIMAVESSRADAVPWTKPQDLEIELVNPLAKNPNMDCTGVIAKTIDLDLFRALLTPAGKEVIDQRRNF